MLYPAGIQTSAAKASGVAFPELPGCLSAGDAREEAKAVMRKLSRLGLKRPDSSSAEGLSNLHH
jgi:predicted RNase H-like HicB family nuclease